MSRWARVIRGTVGMGLTFAAGVGAVAAMLAGVVWLLPGVTGGVELARIVVASSFWGFTIGVAFSGFMALSARGRAFESLSLPRLAALGAGAGLLLFGVLAVHAWDSWSLSAAIGNAVTLTGMGTGSAVVSLLMARRARPALDSGDHPGSLLEGPAA